MKIGLRLTANNWMCRVFERSLPSVVASAAKDGTALSFTKAQNLDDCDLLVIHEGVFDRDDSPLGQFNWQNLPSKPYCLLETNDSAHLTSGGRHALASDRSPLLIWKHCRYENLLLYNHFDGRWHVKLAEHDFEGRMRPYARPQPPLSDELLKRIRVPFTFGAGNGPQRFLTAADQKAANLERSIAVSFAGCIDYAPPPGQTEETLVQKHRRALCDQLDRLAHRMPVSVTRGRELNVDAYQSLLWRSKIVVCPSGWGEYSWRMWEAIFAGCELVMADCSHLANLPCHDLCRWDFADLEAVIRPILIRWDDPRDLKRRMETRERWRQLSSLEMIGARIWRDVAEVLVTTRCP